MQCNVSTKVKVNRSTDHKNIDNYGYAYNGIPQSASDELATLNKKQVTINSIAFTPDGGWAILYNIGDTAHGYATNSIPQDAKDAIVKAFNSTADNILTDIAFTPSNGWALLYQVDEQARLADQEEALFFSEYPLL